MRSFVALSRIDPGYDPERVLTFSLFNPRLQKPQERAVFMGQVHERLAALPGVRSVTAASPFPLDGQLSNARYGTTEAAADPKKFQQATTFVVYPGYFEAMRTKVIGGRTFALTDDRDSATFVVIDTKLAAKAFPGENAVGKRLLIRVRTEEPEWFEVIGVVAHERHESLATDGPEQMFFSDGLFGHGAATTWAVRGNVDPTTLTAPIRATIRQIDPSLAIADVRPFDAFVDRATVALPAQARARARHALAQFLEGLGLFRDLPRLAWVFLLSFGMFGIVVLGLSASLWALRIDVPWYGGLVMLVITAIGIMVPAAPGYVGTLNVACTYGLALFAVPAEVAVAFSWFYWASQWAPVTLVGLFYLHREGLSLRTLGHAQDAA